VISGRRVQPWKGFVFRSPGFKLREIGAGLSFRNPLRC
jgi:hypothetical protein